MPYVYDLIPACYFLHIGDQGLKVVIGQIVKSVIPIFAVVIDALQGFVGDGVLVSTVVGAPHIIALIGQNVGQGLILGVVHEPRPRAIEKAMLKDALRLAIYLTGGRGAGE